MGNTTPDMGENDMPARTTVHGIDLAAPGGIAALLAFHRAHFGTARMDDAADAAAAQAAADKAAAEKAAADKAAAEKAAVDAKATDKGFPENKPIAEMTEKEQANYWKFQSRKHEERSKAFDGLTPEELADLRDKATKQQQLERELMSDKDKAVAEAKDAAKTESDSTYQPRLVRAEFKAAAAGRIEADKLKAIIEPLDLSKFLTAKGDVDEAKVAAYVDGIAPAKQTRTGPTATGLGNRRDAGSAPGDQGRAMAAKRFGIKAAGADS